MDDKIQKKLAQRLASKRRTRRVDQRKSWFWVKQFLLGIFDASLLLLIGVVGYVGYLFYSTPKAELIHRPIAQTSVIYDQSGEHVLYKIHGEENRKVVSHDQISDEIRVATIATEDDSFYSHFGIDPLAILRALRVNFQENDLRQGASTITQQLARNVFLTREKSWKRKILEAVLAIKIETRYSKDEILDFYLNEVPYGSNAYGIQSAAEIYFGKNAADLTLEEATLLAALNKAPTYYSPYGNHADELVVRQGMILRRVEELGLRDQTVVTTARQSDALARVIPFREAIEAPHFVFFVREQLEKLYGREAVEEGGLRVITTLDYDMQKNAERIVREAVAQSGPQHGFHNAALLALNPRSGAIQAMVGSKDFFDERDDGQVNVTIRPRQPGSSFKPIVYATAF
ncbi:penicillin-binding protein, partial [Patescibacteria group bacterium]